MSAQHTPGPWELCHDHPDLASQPSIGYIRPVKREYDSDEVAIVFGCDFEGGKREANARLIASAPELLAEVADQYTELADIHNEWPGRNTPEGQQRLCRLRDLICKATGRDAQDVQDDYTSRTARTGAAA